MREKKKALCCDAMWVGLDVCPRNCPFKRGIIMYLCQWDCIGQRSMLGLDICVSKECSSFSGSAWVVITCPRMKALGQSQRYLGWKEYAELCTPGTIGDEKHLMFECLKLHKRS